MAKLIVNETGKSDEVTTVHQMRYHVWYKRDDCKDYSYYLYRSFTQLIQAWPDMVDDNIWIINNQDALMDISVRRFVGTISWSQE